MTDNREQRTENRGQRWGVLFFVAGFLLFFGGFLPAFAQDNIVDPNSFDHTRYSKTMPESIDDFGKLPFPLNTEIQQIASERPSVITDEEGNIKVFLGGKLILLQEKNGDMTFFNNGQKYCKTNSSGQLINTYDWDNKGLCTIRNEWGEVKGYEHYALGGKISSRYDGNMNLTNVYFYDDEGGKGYWEYNLVTQVFSRVELGRPVVERSKSKDGDIIAYWKKEDGFLWKIEMTNILVKDSQGNIVYGEDKQPLREISEGDRTKYDINDSSGSRPLEVYDQRGVLRRSYVWENHRLAKVIDYENSTYEKYNEFGGTLEQGVISSQGEEVATWIHEWNGSRHVAAYELMYDPLTAQVVRSGKYITYTAEDKIDEVGIIVNESNKRWFIESYEDNGVSIPQAGDKILLEDYVYFYEVKNLSIDEIKSFFHTTDYFARAIYGIIGEYKDKGKADAGLFVKVSYDFLKDSGEGADRDCSTRLVFYDEQNSQNFAVNTVDPAYGAARLLNGQAQNYLEYGEYERALEKCEEFEAAYVRGSEDLDQELGKIYLKMLKIKKKALEKIGDDE